MRFCVFGAGRMGERHITNIAASSLAELRYIVDPKLARATSVADRFGGEPTTDVARAVADKSVDAVIIASATDTHVDLIVAAAQAGKAILCEKPIDLNIEQVDECARQIADYPVPIMIGFQRRFNSTHLAVKKRIEKGDIGRIETISIVSRDPTPPPLSYVATSGGQFHDQMIHDFDLALWITDASGRVEVFSQASALIDSAIGQAGDSDTAMVVLRFENGVLGHIECGRRSVFGYDQRVEVFGSAGMVNSTNLTKTGAEYWSADGTAQREPLLTMFMDRYLPTYAAELGQFIDAVSAGRTISPSFSDGRRALLLADAARQSARANQPVVAALD